MNYGALESTLDDDDKEKFKKKVVSSIRGGFVVHLNKNGAIFKVKPETKYVTCNFFLI